MTDTSKVVAVGLSGGKRTNIIPNESSDADREDGQPMEWDWWVGYGKDHSCQFEGPWAHMAILAAKILRHPNTKEVAPNLFVELPLTEAQENSY